MTAPLTAPALTPEAAQAENSRRQLQARLSGLGDMNGKKLTPEQKEKKLREACEGFESVFIQKMWQEMRNTLPKGGLLHGREEKFWQDMYDQELAKKMTSAGGIGLADMMYTQLSRNLISASRSTAAGNGAAPGGGFTPSAAPLLPAPSARNNAENAAAAVQTVTQPASQTASQTALSAEQGRPAALSVYEGVAPLQGVVASGNAAAAAAATPAPGANAAPAETVVNPPEVEQALAALRARQAASAPSVPSAARGPSGLDLARMAQREAGTRLGPASVRPPLQPAPQTRSAAVHGSQSAQDTPAAMQAQEAVAVAAATSVATAGALAGTASEQAAAEAAPVTRKVRYTTNIPSKGRSRRSQSLIRTLNVDGTGHNSRAGAGLAAYHAAQAQSPAPNQTLNQTAGPASVSDQPPGGPRMAEREAAAQAAQPGQTMAPVTPDAASQNPAERDHGASFIIPPLTAADLRS